MKKFLIILGIFGLIGVARATTVFNSSQVGTNPVAGSVLQTNGTTSTWVATSTLGISGGSASGTPVYYVAASNAPQFEKNIANLICTGVDDGACLNTAINTVSSTFPNHIGTVQLSDGTFNVSTTILNTTNNMTINGNGVGATVININASNTTYGFHLGNAQVTQNNTIDNISNMTIDGNNASDTPLWIDGWGQGSALNNITINTPDTAQYCAIIEDVDRDAVNNIRCNESTLDFRVGKVNTFGKLLVTNMEDDISENNGVAVDFDADSDQSSPNAPGEVTFITPHLQEASGVSSGTGLEFHNGATSLAVIGGGFEDFDTQIQTNGTEVDGNIDTTNFIDSYHQSSYILDAEGYANLTFNADSFQQSSVGFYGGSSGCPNLFFNGTNKNYGNITTLFSGCIASIQGNDVNFVGPEKAESGLASDNYASTYTAQVDNFYYIPTDLSTDLGSYINNLYANATQPMTVYIASSTSFSTPIVAGTNGKFLDIQAAPGVILTYTGSGGSTAITWNDGTEFPKQAHESSGFSLKCSSTGENGIYLGGSHGFRKGTLDGISISGCDVGLNWGTNSYNDTFTNGLIEGNVQNVNFISYSNSGEDDVISNSAIVDPANNSSTNCIVLQSSAVSTLTISGTSIDDCQMVIGDYSVMVNLINDHWENADTFDYGSPAYLIKLGHATTIYASGNTFQNDASTSTKSYAEFYYLSQSDDTLIDNGDIFQGAGGYTLQDAIVGTGKINLIGATNYVNQPGATYAYASTTFSGLDDSQSRFPTILSSTTILGQASATSLCLGGTCNSIWPVSGVTTTTPFTAGNIPVVSSSLALTNSNISQSSSTGAVTISSSTFLTGAIVSSTNPIYSGGTQVATSSNAAAGSYTNANITVNGNGIVTAATNGSASGYPYTFASTSTATEVSATTTLTTVYSLAIPGNTLGLTHMMNFNFGGTYLQDVFSTYAPFELELSYCNQTSSLTLSGTSGQIAANQAWFGSAYLFNSSGTNQQVLGISIGGQKNSGTTGFVYASNAGITTCSSTSTQTFAILAAAQSTSTSNNVWFQWANAILE